MAFNCVIIAPKPRNVLEHLDALWREQGIDFTGSLLCVQLDGTQVPGSVGINVQRPLLGKYQLRCVLKQRNGDWQAWVHGRLRDYGWMECLNFDVVPHEGLREIAVQESALLLYELAIVDNNLPQIANVRGDVVMLDARVQSDADVDMACNDDTINMVDNGGLSTHMYEGGNEEGVQLFVDNNGDSMENLGIVEVENACIVQGDEDPFADTFD